MRTNYKLCFVREMGFYLFEVFFTSDFENQWGDDWDDAPYEHNAGDPYDDFEVDSMIVEGHLEVPSTGHKNSPWSVRDINKGNMPWLRGEHIQIYPGETREEVLLKLEQLEAKIWERRNRSENGIR